LPKSTATISTPVRAPKISCLLGSQRVSEALGSTEDSSRNADAILLD
jgi:hypothetical protein